MGVLDRRAIVMPLAANAFREWQLVVSTPGKQPGLHVLMPDVEPGLDLPVCLAQLRQHLLLVGHFVPPLTLEVCGVGRPFYAACEWENAGPHWQVRQCAGRPA
jgi:hypothetical protein